MAKMTSSTALGFLRNSPREEAKRIVDVSTRLSFGQLEEVPFDYLIAAAEVDPQAAIEVLVGCVYSTGANVDQLIASLGSPEIMHKAVEFAKTPEGFNHARMVLQIAGSAPVPKTSITNLTVRGNVNTQINNGVPRLEDVTRNVDAVLEGL